MSTSLRLALLGSPEALAHSAPSDLRPRLFPLDAGEPPPRAEVERAGVDAAVVLCDDGPDFGPFSGMDVPALAWCAGARRPILGPDDRWVSATGVEGAWRQLPLPVEDARFAAGPPMTSAAARPYWLGPPSERRSAYMDRYRPSPPPLSGSDGDIAVNLRDAPPAELERRAAAALAQGHLLISETLDPGRGLEPGLDYLEARELDEVLVAVDTVVARPQAFEHIRVRGRAKAAGFRASELIGRAASALLIELRRT